MYLGSFVDDKDIQKFKEHLYFSGSVRPREGQAEGLFLMVPENTGKLF